MQGLRVLVTGGAGFIGSHAAKALAAAGARPICYDNLTTGHADAVRWGPLERGDVRDRATVARILTKYRIDAVLHFAASAYVGESVTNPALYYDNNVSGMIALLGAMRLAGVNRIVFSSSCATYGIPDSLPIHEDAPQRPINPYGNTKLICERMLIDYAGAWPLQHAILRYFNAAGADPDGEIGERHDPETHLLPLALRAAAGAGKFRVFGTDYPTPDGTCIRDFIHVADLARAHVMAVSHLCGGGENITLNLGSGTAYSVLEVTAAIARVTGLRVPMEYAPRRPGDPAILTASPDRAAAVLNFRARRSKIDEIIGDAAAWFLATPQRAHG